MIEDMRERCERYYRALPPHCKEREGGILMKGAIEELLKREKEIEELNRKYQELALSVEVRFGCWLCPECMRGAPSGKICRECLEKKYADLQEKLKAVEAERVVINCTEHDHSECVKKIESLTSQLLICKEALESIKVAKCENPEECCHWGLSIMAQSALQKISEVGK